MEVLSVRGLVVKEVLYGEADKILTLITAENGKMVVNSKGAASFRNKHTSSSMLFAYSNLEVKKTKKYFYISDSDLIESFYELWRDPTRFALGTYFCDIANVFSTEDVADEPLLRLTLNALYALATREELPVDAIKAAFEFRTMCEEGFLPMLGRCGMCDDIITSEPVFVDIMNGRILCGKCGRLFIQRDVTEDGTAVICPEITLPVLSALRYIIASPLKRLFSFRIAESDLKRLAMFTETYLESHLESSINSLSYYKSIREDMMGIM